MQMAVEAMFHIRAIARRACSLATAGYSAATPVDRQASLSLPAVRSEPRVFCGSLLSLPWRQNLLELRGGVFFYRHGSRPV